MKKMKRLLVLCLVAAMCLGTMVMPARAAVFSIEDAGNYVDQLYRGLLGREADAAGRLDYVNKLYNDHVSAAHIAELFVSSPEFRARQLTNEEFIEALYKGLLGREADDEGKRTMMGGMDVGNSRNWVFQQIVSSPEFKNVCEQTYSMYVGSYSTAANSPNMAPTAVNNNMAEEYVVRLYTYLLRRADPKGDDPNGVNHWVNQLTQRKMTAAGVAAGIASGGEFNSLSYTDAEFVTQVYWALLNRQPDAGGFANFVNALSAGKTRAWVFAAICASQEFQNLYSYWGTGGYGAMNVNPGTINSTSTPNNLISGSAVNEAAARKYVVRLYRNFLDRTPDENSAEVSNWVSYLTTRSMSAAGVAAAIASSPEARSVPLTRENFIHRVYGALLGREPDNVGLGTYVNAMANGYSRAWVFAKVCQSAEFQNRDEYRNMNVVAGYVNSASYDMG